MRYNELITEGYTGPQILTILQRDCAQFFANKGKGLYLNSGRNTMVDYMIAKEMRTDRRSGFTSFEKNKNLSNYMSQDGYVATRINSLFCLAENFKTIMHPYRTSEFGRTFFIFPIGNYSLTYHDVRDLKYMYQGKDTYINMKDLGGGGWIDILRAHLRDYEILGGLYWRDPKTGKRYKQSAQGTAEAFWSIFKDAFRQSKSLEGVEKDVEVMMHAAYYHAVTPEFVEKYPKLLEFLKDN